jgi:histidinol-phosphate phosphatase family protein
MELDKIELNPLTQAAILCGGQGSRLLPHTIDTPKPMILCNGKPFLWYLLDNLNSQGISDFVLMTGYLSEKIQDYFNDGSLWGWKIEYSDGPVEWDTGRRLWEAEAYLKERFILAYSDNFSPFALNKLLSLHFKNKTALTFMVSHKSPGNIKIDKDGIVVKYDNSRSLIDLNYVEIGYMVIEKSKVFSFYDAPDCSFSSILEKLSKSRQISSFIQHDSYYSISDPIRWKKAEKYLLAKKIIFIDRDGIINHKASRGEYIEKWEDFNFIEDTFNAMKILSQKGFKFIVITNQAGISRGMIKKQDLDFMHIKMKEVFQQSGINILDVYVCPHHWDDNCYCRKPKPGMFLQASKKYLLRLDQTLFIGDDPRDCIAAESAGCSSIFIGNSQELQSLKNAEQPIHVSLTLTESIHSIISFYERIPILRIL